MTQHTVLFHSKLLVDDGAEVAEFSKITSTQQASVFLPELDKKTGDSTPENTCSVYFHLFELEILC